MSEREVSVRLEAGRRNLLDTSRRNRLISYRPSRTSGVEVADEQSAEVFRILVTEAKAMTWAGLGPPTKAEPAQMALHEYRAQAEQELDAFLGTQAPKVNASDTVLNTAEDRTKLGIKLLKIFRDARTVIEESGVNTLFLTLGMLHWKEEVGGQARQSPLILVPVQLEPRQNGSYVVRHDGGEIGFNLSLAAAMLQEFGITLPAREDDPESLDLEAYFDEVRSAIGSRGDWRVEADEIVLGFFSYAKYLLYEDLDEEKWPADGKPSDHDLLESLLSTGFTDSDAGYPSTGSLDSFRAVEDIHDVIGADGSQTLAILEAATGRSMVIQGPPGTGKSQTITNLMADALARGKKVLFVAEKMAALDVVYRRMAESGLADACLQLHSQRARKTEFFSELRRVLEVAEPGRVKAEVELDRLERVRGELNAYAEGVNAPIGTRGISAREAMGQWIKYDLGAQGKASLAIPAMAEWTEHAFLGRLPLVEALDARTQQLGPPSRNPFFGSELSVLMPLDLPGYFHDADAAARTLAEIRAGAEDLARDLGIAPPASLSAVTQLCQGASMIAEAPDLDGLAVNDPAWVTERASIGALIAAIERYAELHAAFDGRLQPSAWDAEVGPTRDALAAHGAKWYRVLIGEFRRAQAHVDQLSREQNPASEGRLQMAQAILDAQQARAFIALHDPLGRRLFGHAWQGEGSRAADLRRQFDWCRRLHEAIASREVPSDFSRCFEHLPIDPTAAPRAETLRTQARTLLESLKALANRLQFKTFPADLIDSFEGGLARLNQWRDGSRALGEMVAYNQLGIEMRAAGLEAIWRLGQSASGDLVTVFRRTWYGTLIREAFHQVPALQQFDRMRQEERVADFRRLDDQLLKINQTRIRLQHYAQVPSGDAGGSAGWLLAQTGKKRNLATIRQALQKASPVVQAIKPIFMMSPMSVAMYLPRVARMFDLIIFDEASQVKPEDAFGAILRGSQMIVVGDTKQMPPTSFFDRLGSDDLDEPETDENPARDMESILALMDSRIAAQSPRRRDLRWHYRSRHHSLIEPSNALFYNHRLFLFPNPEPASGSLGLVLHHGQTTYDRGASRTNREEAHAVAQAVLEHVRRRPEESLMVVAFSQAQQQVIQDEIDVCSQKHPEFAAFADRHPRERLDIKNLENVQGDERDVVFISVGYGRDRSGVAAMSFGPVNAEGGERRLNVLITRARLRCEVFTNLKADDIRVDKSTSAGLFAFREFLQYAEDGTMNTAIATGTDPMSPFEEAVLDGLRARGHDVEPQVGCAGFFIDIGVRDPEQPGRYILGIECDGAQYHSSRTARDRDKLRQMVLEDRGWQIHRIWSTEWFARPKEELERVILAIEAAQRRMPIPTAIETGPEEVVVENLVPPERHYQLAELRATGTPDYASLPPVLREILRAEGPIHIDELVRRVREVYGLPKVTIALTSLVRAVLSTMTEATLEEGGFARLTNQPVTIRSRADVESQRKIDLIAPAEIRLALEEALRESFGITERECIDKAAQKLGFARVTAAMREKFTTEIAAMLASGAITKDGSELRDA